MLARVVAYLLSRLGLVNNVIPLCVSTLQDMITTWIKKW